MQSDFNTDILIIGSGPVGATYAKIISDKVPQAKILMVDLGPKLSDKLGQHFKNIEGGSAKEEAQIKSQGPNQSAYPMITVAERAAAAQKGTLSLAMLARSGTHLVTDNLEDLAKNEMPAASLSSNVGGMGAHWTCACPRPGNDERIPFIPEKELNDAFIKAEELLCVNQNTFPDTSEGLAILTILGGVLNPQLSPERQVQKMPLASKPNEDGTPYWVGSDVILGDLAKPDYQGNFEIRAETICRKLLLKSDLENEKSESQSQNRISGAVIEHLPTGKQEIVRAKIVIVTADAMRTPQLLWASGIRPKALGHYLNEHPFIFTFVELKPLSELTGLSENFAENLNTAVQIPKSKEPTIGVFWVPFDAPNHPFHGQIMHMDVSPLKIETHGNPKHIVGLGWGCLKEVRYEDHIVFSENEKDYLGMPKMSFKFTLTEKDRASIAEAMKIQAKAAAAFGKVIKEGEQTLMPPGTSLHYEGTTRMGKENDGTSVCDTFSQVWDFENLFVGGNGVIPMATTSNPTLTSVALAIRSAERIVKMIS